MRRTIKYGATISLRLNELILVSGNLNIFEHTSLLTFKE